MGHGADRGRPRSRARALPRDGVGGVPDATSARRHDVVPDVFAMPGAARRAWGPPSRAGADRRPARLVVLRDDDAADGRHVRGRPLGRRLRARRRPTPCSAASRSPTGCAGRPATTPRRRCTAGTASSTTRRSPPHHVGADDRRAGRRARRRLPPRQRHPADLLRARRRGVRVAARRPGAGVPVPHRLRRRDRRRAGERQRPATCRSPPATDDDAYLAALDRALRRGRRVRPGARRRVARASTRTSTTRCATSPLTTDGFGRCGAAVAALGRPLVVLQEGGYADDALGANVAAMAARRAGGCTPADRTGRSTGRRLDRSGDLMSSRTLRPAVGVALVRGVERDPVDHVAVAAVQLGGDLLGRADDGERVEDLVVDQRRPSAPTRPAWTGALSSLLQAAPAVQLEHAAVRRRRAVEGDLLAGAGRRRGQLARRRCR